MFNKLGEFLKHVFDEPNGTWSSSRLLAGTVVVATLIWVSYLVITTHSLPDLHGAALFIGAGFSGYGVNKISSMIGGNNDK